jgi:hypothetical protein
VSTDAEVSRVACRASSMMKPARSPLEDNTTEKTKNRGGEARGAPKYNDAAVVVFSFDARKHERADAGVESCVYFATGALTFGTLMISNLQILIIRECEARQLLYFPFGGNLLKGSQFRIYISIGANI